MTTHKEALTLALEALDYPYWREDMWLPKRDSAITAIKEALAQPEHEPDEVDIRSRLYQRIHELETQLAQPEQEPVAKDQWWAKELQGLWGSSDYVVTLDTRRAAFTALSVIFNATPPQCKGIPRKGCNYLAGCDSVCNKCGQVHHHHQMVAEFDAPQRKPLTSEQAYEIGAKGGEPSEAERLLFEAWMRGHCWAVIGDWNGKTYVHPQESTGFVNQSAMNTRQLWAAWRDRAALEAAHGIKE